LAAVFERGRPVEARVSDNTMLEVPEQPSEDLPTIGPAEFEISLAIDPHDTVGMYPGRFQFVPIEFLGRHDREKLIAGHFDELHSTKEVRGRG
jgi:hypothetical protein